MKRKEFFRKSVSLLTGSLALRLPIHTAGDGDSPILPPRLQPGDSIGLVAPAGIIFDETEFKRMKQILEKMGLRVVFGRYIRNRHGYFAGTDQERSEDLNRFITDPGIRAIMAVRGGWGCNRILDKIHYNQLRDTPKIICGFSDITALHLAIFSQTGLTTFHGPNGNSDWTRFTRSRFAEILFSEKRKPLLKNPSEHRTAIRTIVPGKVSGRLIGGNLTLVTSLVGSHYMPEMEGAILFLEDVGEDIYRIDRMFSQLQLSGVLDRISGVVFGNCTDCRLSPGGSLSLTEVLSHYLVDRKIPAFTGSVIGHGPDNFTIPIGVKAEMDASSGTIRLLEPAVA